MSGTLMEILAGIHRADAGTIHLESVRVTIEAPADAARLGIVDTLDVAGNIFLGREAIRGPLRLLDRRWMEAEAPTASSASASASSSSPVASIAIAAAVVGRCSLRGGQGSVLGIVLGAADRSPPRDRGRSTRRSRSKA